MITREFSRDFLMDELDLPYSAIEETLTDSTRWSLHYNIVFEYEGKFYTTSYSCGATEYQDERPWEYQKTVTCTEVEQKDVIVKKWVPVGMEEKNNNGKV